ncbi:unnamed protein product [Alopecurus aequalis]
MEPPSKRIRTATDRLSDLPDCLIHNILAFIESRQVVRWSLLSRRWRHLWRSMPCLDIDLTVFRHGDRCQDRSCCKRNYAETKTCKQKVWRPFEEFSNNLMLLNDVRSLDRLRIHIPGLDSDDRRAIRACSRWVTRGIQCNPTVIDIHVDYCWSWGSCFFPDLGSTTTSRLTRLLLRNVRLHDGFAEQLRSGCPMLEELSLVGCCYHFGEIMSRSLRHLIIDDVSVREGIVVTAPRLTSLHTSFSTTTCPDGIRVTDTSSFIKASICVTMLCTIDANFSEKLCNILNVMHLQLFGAKTMDTIQWIQAELPKFHNVRTLLIDRCDLKTNTNIQALGRLLQSAPNLEKLTLQNCEFSDRSDGRSARAKMRHVALESKNLMSFECDNLEVIEIKHSKDGNIDELFELQMGLWRNLGKTIIKLTKV